MTSVLEILRHRPRIINPTALLLIIGRAESDQTYLACHIPELRIVSLVSYNTPNHPGRRLSPSESQKGTLTNPLTVSDLISELSSQIAWRQAASVRKIAGCGEAKRPTQQSDRRSEIPGTTTGERLRYPDSDRSRHILTATGRKSETHSASERHDRLMRRPVTGCVPSGPWT